MKDFIIFFEEKEGTSPLVQLLNNFDQISIVHQVGNSGWEPFDRHNCGAMSMRSLEQCLDLIFGEEPRDMERLNRIYAETATRPLEKLNKGGSVGFKMRFRPPGKASQAIHQFILRSGLLRGYPNSSFKRMMIDVLRRNKVVAFLAVRQDVFRWGLSIHHGDGTGKPGHLQFKLASGEISKDQIGKLRVNCESLDRIIARCEQDHVRKRLLMNELQQAGIEVHPLRYEDFISDKVEYFRRLCNILEIPASTEEINAALARGTHLEKVHSDRISDFVENDQEVMERFGNHFVSWQ